MEIIQGPNEYEASHCGTLSNRRCETQTKAAEYQKTHRMNEIKGRILAEMSAIATC